MKNQNEEENVDCEDKNKTARKKLVYVELEEMNEKIKKIQNLENIQDLLLNFNLKPYNKNSYTILGDLGVGGFGTVKKIREKETTKLFAVKTLDLSEFESQDHLPSQVLEEKKTALISFFNDIYILRKINSIDEKLTKKIINYGASFFEEERGRVAKIHIIMEEGVCNLEDLFKFRMTKNRKGEAPFNELELSLILYDVSSALVFLEENKIYHSDIKPSNIVLTERSSISFKIVDFGVSKVIQDPDDLERNTMYAGDGTPEYTSPEAMNCGKQFSPFHSDVYSLGKTMAKIMTRMHMNNRTYSQLLLQLVNEMMSPNWRERPNFRQIHSFAKNNVRLQAKFVDASIVIQNLCDEYKSFNSNNKKSRSTLPDNLGLDDTQKLIKLTNKIIAFHLQMDQKGQVKISLAADYERVSVLAEENNWLSFTWIAKRKYDHKLFFVKSFDVSKFEGDTKAQAAFKQEIYEQIKLWSTCFHPSLMPLHGYDEQEGIISCLTDYMDISIEKYVMELAPGRKLAQFIFRIFQSVAEGLNYLKREKNVLHKNISPKNIYFLRSSGEIRMLDFFFGEKLMTQLYFRREPQFEAPEIIKNLGAKNFYHQSVNEKCDVFSLGLTLVSLLCWKEYDKYKGLNKDPKSREGLFLDLKQNFPEEIKEMLLEMVQESPDRRPSCEMLFGVSKIIKKLISYMDLEASSNMKRPSK